MKKYILITLLCIGLTVLAVHHQIEVRGYVAFGGEYLILAVPLLVWVLEKQTKKFKQVGESLEDEE